MGYYQLFVCLLPGLFSWCGGCVVSGGVGFIPAGGVVVRLLDFFHFCRDLLPGGQHVRALTTCIM